MFCVRITDLGAATYQTHSARPTAPSATTGGGHIWKLSLDGGELHVEGRVDSVTYEDDGAGRGGFFSRLFG